MAQTTPREAITCAAIGYICNNQSTANIQDFSKIIRNYYFDNDNTGLSQIKNNLASSFNLQRIKDIYPNEKKALEKSGSGDSYSLKKFKEDFPEGKNNSTDDGGPTRLDAEIKSAYSTAEILKTTSILGNLSQYIVHDQASDFMISVKDKSLKRTMNALDLPTSVGADILSSIDIILVKKSKQSEILKEFKDKIFGNNVSDMDILNNLAHGTTGQNTFRTLTNKYFASRDMLGISLKKVPSNRKADFKVVGTIAGAGKGLELYLDPYTEFLARVSEIENRSELFKLIDDMVEVTEILPTEPRAVFSVNFKLNYRAVDISDKITKINLQIGRSGFNASETGQMGFVGGASYAVTLPILKKYPRYNQMVREVISIREKGFNFAVNKNNVPSNLKNNYSKALRMVKKNVLVLYDASDNIVIKNFCQEYDNAIGNLKDSFQEYRIAVSKLCKGKSLTAPHGQLIDIDKDNMKVTGVPKTLQNDYVHAQGLWMYTRQKADLKKYFKKQISLTLYGLMSKKGSRVYHSNQKGKGLLTEDAFVKEFKAKNNKNKLAKVTTAPFVLIS
jgi:hypothetical protein